MNTQEIKEYLHRAYELEKNIYTMKQTVAQMSSKATELGIPKEILVPERVYPKTDSEGLGAAAWIWAVVASPVGWIIFGALLVFGILNSALIPILLLIAVVILVLIGVLGKNMQKSENRKLSEEAERLNQQNRMIYDKSVKEEQLRLAKENRQKEMLQRDIELLKKQWQQSAEVLQKLYQINIVHPKYQNFVAIAMLYEYFDTGRCTLLEGHEGAYNIYENESRLNRIITQLDSVIEHLAEIQHCQFMMYQAINESRNDTRMLYDVSIQNMNSIAEQNANMQQLVENSNLIAYNSKRSAENIETLKYIVTYDKRQKGELPLDYTKYDI